MVGRDGAFAVGCDVEDDPATGGCCASGKRRWKYSRRRPMSSDFIVGTAAGTAVGAGSDEPLGKAGIAIGFGAGSATGLKRVVDVP